MIPDLGTEIPQAKLNTKKKKKNVIKKQNQVLILWKHQSVNCWDQRNTSLDTPWNEVLPAKLCKDLNSL